MTTILHILQHALGRDEHGRGTDYRNHFVTGEDSADIALCREAVTQGLMRDHGPNEWCANDHIFTVTDAGKAYIAEHSPPEPKRTRGQERYRRWLDIADVCDITFGEWLKTGGAP